MSDKAYGCKPYMITSGNSCNHMLPYYSYLYYYYIIWFYRQLVCEELLT